MEGQKEHSVKLSQDLSVHTLEKALLISERNQHLSIGILKGTDSIEKRVPLSPSAVKLLNSRGIEIKIEREAGEPSRFYDHDYSEAGAEICDSINQVLECDIILSVTPPTVEHVLECNHHSVWISPIQPATIEPKVLALMIEKKMTAFAFEFMMDASGALPFVRAMSEIAGINSILIGAEYLSSVHHGNGLLFGSVTGVAPTKVVIIGAGQVGTSAARIALNMGADVRIFDNNIYKLINLQNTMKQRVYTSAIEPELLQSELKTADLVITAVHSKDGKAPLIISEQMVTNMKHGAVIVDVSIDQGGCVETSSVTNHMRPTFTKYGIIHYCVPNIPSIVARTASQAISNILHPILVNLAEQENIKSVLEQQTDLRKGIYIYEGRATHPLVEKVSGKKYIDINLLFSSSF